MRTASAGTIALLNSGNEFYMADLYTVTLFDGTVYRWTSYDISLVMSGHTWLCVPDAPVITRGKTRVVAGLEVDTLEVTLGVGDSGFTLNSLPVPNQAAQGLLDGALVQLERVFMGTPGDTTNGSVILFSGFVAQCIPSSTAVRLMVKSDLAKLLVQMPRNVFQTNCSHVLYDAGCALVKATYTVSGIVGAATSTAIFQSNLTQADDYFRLGTMVFTSGANVGLRFAIRAFANTNGVVGVVPVMPVAPTAGDTFTIAPGCDKSVAMCVAKFNNLVHNRSFPFIPPPESLR